MLGIGSNQGDRQGNIDKAIEHLSRMGISINKISGYYDTEPWGYTNQPRFLNVAVSGHTDLTPDELLNVSKGIEQDIGRTATFRWGPRVIDIDILLYGDMIINKEDIVIPHPFMDKREFVLKPLSEILPDIIHPIRKKTIKELLEELR
ncbi:MAG: 2-amino-4-hydroxy-6-hydroxymethyldihydropteridine diphosphokinase [Thermodesulfovibrionales bacterium]|nr:2-amino-4-hydroxy-6-hydroxymethyldihydropteridine diphosphokinase [Thermodesulfovibrionales bacterium]